MLLLVAVLVALFWVPISVAQPLLGHTDTGQWYYIDPTSGQGQVLRDDAPLKAFWKVAPTLPALACLESWRMAGEERRSGVLLMRTRLQAFAKGGSPMICSNWVASKCTPSVQATLVDIKSDV